MSSDKQMNEKWEELIGFAQQHATGKGLQTGIKWLEDSFNEYLSMTDETYGYGMGGQPGSQYNRQVLAGRIVLQLGPFVGGRHLLDEAQLAKLKKSLQDIVESPTQDRGLKV
jgi:hypothetical protein